MEKKLILFSSLKISLFFILLSAKLFCAQRKNEENMIIAVGSTNQAKVLAVK